MFKIVLDAGHGRYTAGKECSYSFDKSRTKEWVLNNRICIKVAEILNNEFQKGVDYDLIRSDDTSGETDVALSTRVKTARDWNADLLISVHHDAGAKGTSAGGPTVYWRKHSDGDDWIRESYAKALYNNFIASTGPFGNRASDVIA